MIQNKKRIISLILMLTLLVSALVVGAVTASAEGEGSYVKVTSADDFTSGQYVIISNNNYALSAYDSTGWVLTKAFTASGDEIAKGDAPAVWTLTVSDAGVTLTDANGKSIKPKSGNNNGIQTGSYSWSYSLTNGTFQFKGTGSDTTTLALNTGSSNKARAYKNTTVSGNSGNYPSYFTLYKFVESTSGEEGGETPACEHTNTEAVGEARDATCTEAGITAGLKCADCGETITAQETIPANGHDFDRTTTGNGRCKNCEFVAPKATFVFAEGDNEVVYATNKESHVKAPAVADLVGSYAKEYTFAGWAKMENGIDGETTTAPTLYQSEKYITLTEDAVFYAVYTYQVVSGNASDDFVLTDIENIKADDLVVITMRKSATLYALPNNGGASTPTAANLLSVSNNKLSETPDESLLWNISKVNDGYVIYVNGSTTYLYCINDNSGVRVGTGDNNIFTISNGYLKNIGQSRYVGVYTNKPDWRCYTSTTINIGSQSLELYVKSNGITTYYVTSLECNHTYESEQTQAPSCTVPGVTTYTCSNCGDSYTEAIPATNHPNKTTTTVGATCTVDGSITVTCDDCGATISTETIPALGHNHEACPHTALIGNEGYATIQDAIAGATAGSEIVLNSDIEVLGDLTIENQVTINLNGKTLTAGAVVTFYEGTKFIGEGKLEVAKNSLYNIKGETKYVPVWNAPVLGENDEVVTPGYYTFSEVKDQIKKSTVEDTEVVVFRPAFENKEIKKEFVDGASDNGLSFVIRITWEGLAKPKEYTLTDDFIANVYNAEKPKAIQLGFENWQAGVEYTVTLRIVSGGIYYETTLCTMKDGAITVPKIVTE